MHGVGATKSKHFLMCRADGLVENLHRSMLKLQLPVTFTAYIIGLSMLAAPRAPTTPAPWAMVAANAAAEAANSPRNFLTTDVENSNGVYEG